jgi:hypothetical protein
MAGKIMSGLALDRALRTAVRSVCDGIALDRSPDNRRKTVDGRLEVRENNISKACVSPYVGNEIPDWEALGLDPDRIYQLFRDPAELKKAASTFNRLPLLLLHKPSTADDHPRELTVGTTGDNAEFDAPYLKNSLTIWDREGVDAVESKRQHELSPGYRYVARMEPGTTPDGEYFDGRMTEIVGNHLCLVDLGRTGHDVVVGDSAGAAGVWRDLETVLTEANMSYGGKVTKVALDSALRVAAQDATNRAIRAMQEADTARARVAPYMTVSEMALDGVVTADRIYDRFLRHHGVNCDGFNAAAYRALTDMTIQDLRSGRIQPPRPSEEDMRAFSEKLGITYRRIRHV